MNKRVMQTVNATEAKNRFGKLLEDAQSDPVVIERHERPLAVLISYKDWQKAHENCRDKDD